MKYKIRISLFVLFCATAGFNLNAEWDSSIFGQVKVSGFASATYDSRVFGIPSNYYNQLKSSGGNPGTGIPVDELKSEDDFILKFSPAVHLAKKVSLFKFSGTAISRLDKASIGIPSDSGSKKLRFASLKAFTPSPIMEGAQTANTLVSTMNATPSSSRQR